MTSLKITTVVSRAARCAGALFCALAFGLSAGAAHAQTPFYRASAQEVAGPPGTIIRSEPMLFAPAGAQAYRVRDPAPWRALVKRGRADAVRRYTADMATSKPKDCCVRAPGHAGAHDTIDPLSLDI